MQISKDLKERLSGLIVTLCCAYLFKWQISDFIWGFWISSLIIGLLYIIRPVALLVIKVKGWNKLLAAMLLPVVILFFGIQFVLFHLGQAMFLNYIFPKIEGLRGFESSLSLVAASLRSYWPLIISNFISNAAEFFTAPELDNKVVFRPFINIVKMHFMIIMLALSRFSAISGITLYPMILIYYLPWQQFFMKFAKK